MVTKATLRDYTKVEWGALRDKMDHPDRTIICPRCGNEIAYEEIGNSISVYCQSENCIFGGLRGL